MDIAVSHDDLAFRDEVRAFVSEAFDAEMRERLALSKNGYLDKSNWLRWLNSLYKKGWAAPDWPIEHGGTGWSLAQKYTFDLEMALAGAPSTSTAGLQMCAPVIMAFGTEQQKSKHLPRILRSDVWFCQGYSEPGAGSDLASLSLAAKRDGDQYILNGSKIWTSFAQWSDWMFLLVRTGRGEFKQAGITFLLLEMNSPGISVVPIPTMDGSREGDQELNQVFFEDVRVPVANVVGEEGQGWSCAKYLLQFERGTAFAPSLIRMVNHLRKTASLARSDAGDVMLNDPRFRQKLALAEIEVEAIRATELRVFSGLARGEAMGVASSMLKLAGTEMQQILTRLELEAVGHFALPYDADPWGGLEGRPIARPVPDWARPIAGKYFNYRKTSIYGGSSEIQKNIIAKAVLGL